MKIGLIGHSHSVCLLDAVGPWRDQIRAPLRSKRPGYSSAYDGWDTADTGETLIRLPDRKIGSLTADLFCSVIFGGTPDYNLVDGSRVEQGGSIVVSPILAKIGPVFGTCDVLISVVFGNELVHNIWLDNLPHYDFIEESLPGPVRPDAQPIDRTYIARILDEYVSRVFYTCLILRQFCPTVPIKHVLPPPPLEDPSRLKFHEGFGKAMAECGTLDPILRLKWYRAYAGMLKSALDRIGVQLMLPPAAAFTEKGFFWEDLSNGLTHGNTRYGALLWETIAANLGPSR